MDLKARVSRYMSSLLRHSPENLKMDAKGFVSIDELLEKIRARYPIDKRMIIEIVDKSDNKRFEVNGNKIRAIYGHTIPVDIAFEEDSNVKLLYHGTTAEAASNILKEGLKPMKRKWVHLSPTVEAAIEVGKRRTTYPIVLEIDAEAAREDGMKLYRATDKVFLSGPVPGKYIKIRKKT